MNLSKQILFGLIFLLGSIIANAQIFSAGAKFQEKTMFQATFNAPIFFDKNKPFDIFWGADYTTKNSKTPSGLAPQLGFAYYLVDEKSKNFMLSANFSAGYLFDFNKKFDNQFRFSPHIYFEFLSLINVRLGYDYLTPINQGYPFVSIGIGGGMMFRHFSVM